MKYVLPLLLLSAVCLAEEPQEPKAGKYYAPSAVSYHIIDGLGFDNYLEIKVNGAVLGYRRIATNMKGMNYSWMSDIKKLEREQRAILQKAKIEGVFIVFSTSGELQLTRLKLKPDLSATRQFSAVLREKLETSLTHGAPLRAALKEEFSVFMENASLCLQQNEGLAEEGSADEQAYYRELSENYAEIKRRLPEAEFLQPPI